MWKQLRQPGISHTCNLGSVTSLSRIPVEPVCIDPRKLGWWIKYKYFFKIQKRSVFNCQIQIHLIKYKNALLKLTGLRRAQYAIQPINNKYSVLLICYVLWSITGEKWINRLSKGSNRLNTPSTTSNRSNILSTSCCIACIYEHQIQAHKISAFKYKCLLDPTVLESSGNWIVPWLC